MGLRDEADGALSQAHRIEPSRSPYRRLLEASNGDIVGIEVKATSSPSSSDFKGLAFLSGRLGERFRVGIVLCLAPTAVPMGPKLMALPVNALWQPPRAPSVLG